MLARVGFSFELGFGIENSYLRQTARILSLIYVGPYPYSQTKPTDACASRFLHKN